MADSDEPWPPPQGPDDWREKTDPGIRRVLNSVSALKDDMDERLEKMDATISRRVRTRPSKAQVLFWIGSASVVVVGGALTVTRAGVADVREVQATQAGAIQGVKEEIQEVRGAVQEGRKDTQDLYNYLLTRKRQPRLEKAPGEEDEP